MYNEIINMLKVVCIILSLYIFNNLNNISYAQDPDEPAVIFEKKVNITVSNPLDIKRDCEPVEIALHEIIEHVPDFNRRFFRLKNTSESFEPLDIPSQILMIPEAGAEADKLVFQVNLAPKEEKIIELWYNPGGTGIPEYPLKTQSFDNWYRPGNNLAWENEIIAYRSYNGIVDFFAKTYPHLRLHDLPPDSYHHERLWGIDPYMVGKKPGLGGVMVFDGDNIVKYYGVDERVSRTFTCRAYSEGPLAAGGLVTVMDNQHGNLKNLFTLYSGRFENNVRSWIMEHKNNVLIAPGMQKFENVEIIMEEKEGFIIGWGCPVEEYGTIGTAIIWNPDNAEGIHKTDDGIFTKLLPSRDFSVNYLSIAVWNRASADQPRSSKAFVEHVRMLALCLRNPVIIKIH
ncbi:hypothetical protein ES707_18152 [subsurface metagenome]